MKTKALEKKEAEPLPQPVVKIIKDKELQDSTIQAMEDIRKERDDERARADHFKKQVAEYELSVKLADNRLHNNDKIQKTLNSTISELEKEISVYKEKLKSATEKLSMTENNSNSNQRKILHLENELYEQQAKRERAEREANRLEDHNRELEENMNKEQSMRHSAERRANRNEQFQEIWKRDRNPNEGSRQGHYAAVNGTANGVIVSKNYPMTAEQELAAYKRLTDDLNNQLSSETNIRRHIERRLRQTDSNGLYQIPLSAGTTPRMGSVNLNATQNALYQMNGAGYSRTGVNFNIHSDEYFNKCKKALRDSLDLRLGGTFIYF